MNLRGGFSPAVGLLLLSALWAFGWLLPDLFLQSGATTISLPLGQAILFSVFAAMTWSVAAAQRLKFPRGRHAWKCAGIGVGLFVIPTSTAAFARGSISNFDQVAVLCLTPVFAVALEPYLQNTLPRRGKAALAGTLVAIAGILCLFPLETPSSFRAGAALVVLLVAAFALAATNCIAVRLASALPGRSGLPMAALAGGACAIYFAVIAAVTRPIAWDSSSLPNTLFSTVSGGYTRPVPALLDHGPPLSLPNDGTLSARAAVCLTCQPRTGTNVAAPASLTGYRASGGRVGMASLRACGV